MSTYSLITVHHTNADGTVDGGWLQDHIGTLATARKRADDTETVNHGISIAVVPQVGFCGPAEIFHSQQRLA